MKEEILRKYNAEEILASLPSDRGELFIGYRPAAQGDIWREQFHQILDREAVRRLSRSVFQIKDNIKDSVVVEVAECASAPDAVKDLLETLVENQAADLEPGPKFLQPAAFQHPKQAPGGLFFVRGNLRISILSQTKESGNVDKWLEVIQQDLDWEPEDARDSLEFQPRDSGEGVIELSYIFPWKVGEQGWFKFVTKGAVIELGKQEGELILGPAEKEITVRGWVLERGRESYKGVFNATAGAK